MCCLCVVEIFFIDPHANITRQLIDWFQRSYSPPDYELNTLVPDSTDYWNVLVSLTLQGRIYESLQLLHMNTSIHYHAPVIVDTLSALLETLPSLASYTHNDTQHVKSVNDIITICTTWKQQVDALLCIDAVRSNAMLHRYILLLSGDADTLRASCTNWQELVCAYVLFVKPYMMKDEMTSLAKFCMQSMQQSSSDSESESGGYMDEIHRFIFCFDAQAALDLTNKLIDEPWYTQQHIHTHWSLTPFSCMCYAMCVDV